MAPSDCHAAFTVLSTATATLTLLLRNGVATPSSALYHTILFTATLLYPQLEIQANLPDARRGIRLCVYFFIACTSTIQTAVGQQAFLVAVFEARRTCAGTPLGSDVVLEQLLKLIAWGLALVWGKLLFLALLRRSEVLFEGRPWIVAETVFLYTLLQSACFGILFMLFMISPLTVATCVLFVTATCVLGRVFRATHG